VLKARFRNVTTVTEAEGFKVVRALK
jgi:16S rRNA G1207 methylase RsmC